MYIGKKSLEGGGRKREKEREMREGVKFFLEKKIGNKRASRYWWEG